MAVADTHSHDHHDDHHDHGEFIAHHFDSLEQQFDSGKLGIWLFLVTEVLFFSGLFVAYTLYRNHHPEIFDQAHVYLNKYLGGLNTIVLLFSSLTMALGVRSAQLGKNKSCGVYVLATMVCATMFLGVKAVEYSHKWDMGIFVRSAFDYTNVHPEQTMISGMSDYLVKLSVIPLLLLIGFIIASVVFRLTDKSIRSKFWMGMAITVGGYFIGVVIGIVFMAAKIGEAKHAYIEPARPIALYAMTQDHDHAEQPHAVAGGHGDQAHAEVGGHDMEHTGAGHDESGHDMDHMGHHADVGHDESGHDMDHTGVGHDESGHGDDHGDGHGDGDHAHAGGDHDHHGEDHGHGEHGEIPEFDRNVGTFFSIYYCMTGLHAIHIIAGIIALGWLYWRSLNNHWRSDYFGPVDYVGLYWPVSYTHLTLPTNREV